MFFLSKSEAEMYLEEDHIIYLRWLIDGLRLACSAFLECVSFGVCLTISNNMGVLTIIMMSCDIRTWSETFVRNCTIILCY